MYLYSNFARVPYNPLLHFHLFKLSVSLFGILHIKFPLFYPSHSPSSNIAFTLPATNKVWRNLDLQAFDQFCAVMTHFSVMLSEGCHSQRESQPKT